MSGQPVWPDGSASGVGSLPGEDIDEALRFVLGELPDLPYLPELPARGPQAELVGRGCAHLAELHVDRQPSGWRLVPRSGADERAARELLVRDLDALEVHALGFAGTLKVQLAGAWTLAAAVELPSGEKLLADPGAVRDLVASLVEGVQRHLGELRRRVPDARLLVQVDEPALPAVLAGLVPTVSGLGRLPPVEEPVAEEALRQVLGAVAVAGATPAVHCCAARLPVGLLRRGGAAVLSVDVTSLEPRTEEALGEAVDAGALLLAGALPALGPGAPPPVRDVVASVRRVGSRLGIPASRLASVAALTPACGLAGASTGWARTATALLRRAGRALAEDSEAAG